MSKTMYKREFTFHDKVNNVINCVVEIYWLNKRWELHLRLQDYELNAQYTELQQEFIDYCKSFGWNKFVTEDIQEEVKDTLDEFIDNILEADNERIEQIAWEEFDAMVEANRVPEELEELINDEKLQALARHLDVTPYEAVEDIPVSKYDDCLYEYGNREYYVYTDEEADDAEKERVENVIEECYLSELTRDNKNHPALNYIDMDKWIDDWCGNRGENLSGYDGCEHEEKVNGTWYYIYRHN